MNRLPAASPPARFTREDARALVSDPARAAAAQLFERQAAWLMLLADRKARVRRSTITLLPQDPTEGDAA